MHPMHHTNTLFYSHHRFIRVFLCLGMKSGRLERTDSSPKSIAKEILQSLEKSPIKPLNLEATPTPTKQAEKMEQQQGRN